MANEGHVARLRQGVNVWNAWREKKPNIRPNLSKVDLSRADLNEADLSGANLSEAGLIGANLSAVLRGADLNEVNLSWADLRRAVLHADLSPASAGM
jgi:uncharacterized protein YjbI with pentapeptide repeats